MRSIVVAAALCAVSGVQVTWAQTPADCKPSSLNIAEAKYPCVYPDKRATFRVIAPNAEKVRIRVGPGFDMQKGPDGIWDVTTTPLVEGFHYYTVQIDGAVVADPSTHDVLRIRLVEQRHRDPRVRRRVLRREGRAARPRGAAALLLDGHPPVASRLRLHASRLRQQGPQQLSGALPAARVG